MPLAEIDRIAARRLTLRPVREDDLPALLVVNGDPEVTRFLPYDTWRGLDDARAWLARMQALVAGGTARQLVIEHRDGALPIGTVLLFRHDEPSARLELGYVLGRAHWRQGYAREALGAAVSHAFGPLGLRRLEAEVNTANAASAALLRALGFHHEGVLRQRWVAKGRAYDVDVFGLLAAEWPASAP